MKAAAYCRRRMPFGKPGLQHGLSFIACHRVWSALRTMIVLLGATAALHAFAQFRSTQWTADSGLPQNIIRGLVQTPDGYLWIATLNGVARFDGVRFTIFDKSNSPGITANRFSSMVAGANGDLWLYSESGAIIRYHHGVFRTLGTTEGIAAHSARAITGDGKGHVWLLENGTIFQWRESSGRFEPIPRENGIPYQPLNWDGTGFWGTSGQQLYTFSHGDYSVHIVPKEFPLASIDKVAVGADGAIWLALPDGRFARLFNDKWEAYSKPIETTFQSQARASWKARIDNHLDRTLLFPSLGEQRAIRYNVIIDDDEHNIWVGSEGQGLFRVQRQTIYVYSTDKGLAGANVYPVLYDRHGDMWIGTWPAGLTQYHDGTFKTYTLKDGLPGLVTSLADDSSNNLWIGTHDGLAVLSQGQLRKPHNQPRDLRVIQVIYRARDGSLLLGTQSGVQTFSVSRKVGGFSLEPGPKLSIGDARVIVEDRHGDIWLGGYSGLTKMHNGVLTHWTELDGLPSNSIRSIYEDAEGVLWVGTYDGGLGRFADGKWTHYNTKNGLFDNGVFQILEDEHDNLWMSSNRGIFSVDKKQLNDVAAGRRNSVITISYGRSDGMLNVECNGGLWPAGAKDKEGKLWFPTQEGVAVVDPRSVRKNEKPPRVSIESTMVDHVSMDLEKPIVVKPGQSGVEILYTALSFSKPEQLTFRYMMDGLDSAWEYVGYRRTAYFSHMSPGNYVFHVMAANSDGVWSATQSSVIIRVLPPFYLTNWFIAIVLGLSLLMMYAIWSYRIRRFKQRAATQQAFSQQLMASQENERRRISADLHDSLGQRLVVIKNLTHFLSRPKAATLSEEEWKQMFEEISTEVSLAIEETRNISYNLRPFQLDRLGLSKAIEALVRSVSGATGIDFSTSIDNIDDSFPEELRINFYRIVQESLNNIVKHSHATRAEVHIEKRGRDVMLSIRDNGVGIGPDQKGFTPGKGGFGLTGIRERATLLGGAVKLHSQSSSGTLLTIEFHRGK